MLEGEEGLAAGAAQAQAPPEGGRKQQEEQAHRGAGGQVVAGVPGVPGVSQHLGGLGVLGTLRVVAGDPARFRDRDQSLAGAVLPQ